MKDPLFAEIERKLRCLNSDAKVNMLTDLVSSMQSNLISETMARLVGSTCRHASPENGIFLIKFVTVYSKKDQKFFKCIEDTLPGIVLLCSQVSSDKHTLKLYVEGWQMGGKVWQSIASKSLGLLKLYEIADPLREVIAGLDGRQVKDALMNATNKAEIISACEVRLEQVIRALNILTSI